MKDLKKELLGKCKANSKSDFKQFENILNNKSVGYMINERFINLPPQIALPFHTSVRFVGFIFIVYIYNSVLHFNGHQTKIILILVTLCNLLYIYCYVFISIEQKSHF